MAAASKCSLFLHLCFLNLLFPLQLHKTISWLQSAHIQTTFPNPTSLIQVVFIPLSVECSLVHRVQKKKRFFERTPGPVKLALACL